MKMRLHERTTRCSTFPACRASTRSAPSTSTPAVDALLADARATDRARRHRRARRRRGTRVVEPLADALDRLDRAWSAVRHLNAVVNTPELRDAYNANLPKVTAFYTDLGAGPCACIAELPRAARGARIRDALDAAQRKLIDNELRDFRLGGAELPTPARRASRPSRKSSRELVDAVRRATCSTRPTHGRHYVDDDARARRRARRRRRRGARGGARPTASAGYKLTLRMPCYLPVMQYADDRALRETLHRAYATRASELGANPEWDNTPADRAHPRAAPRGGAAARLPRTTPRCRWCRRWRSTPDEVLAFLRDLARRAKPFAERDFAELRRSRATSSACADLAAVGPGATRREKLQGRALRVQRAGGEAVLPRGPGARRPVPASSRRSSASTIREAHAPRGIRPCASSTIRDRARARSSASSTSTSTRAPASGAAPGWTTRSTAAASRRRAAASGRVSDLQLRGAGRRQAGAVHARRSDHAVPRVRPRPAPPAHAGRRAGVSGIQGVEWDAVELPSQFMENFCWEWDVLRAHDARTSTPAQPLPRELFDKMLAAKNFQSGMATRAPDRVRAVRHAAARRVRRRQRTDRRRRRRRCSTQVRARGRRRAARRRTTASSQSFSPHLRRRLRGRLLQLQVGRGAVGRRVTACSRRQGVLSPAVGRALPRRGPRARRQPPGAGVVRRLPRPPAPTRRASAA